MYFVYVLKSLKDKNLYIGYTKNVSQRVKIHNEGKVLSTKYRKPLILVGYKTYKTKNEARWIEYNIKKHSDKKEKFIKELEAAGPEGLWPGGR